MMERQTIKDWSGKVIGTIETDTATGNKRIKDFYGKVLGTYDKRLNLTKDFYGRVVAQGDQSSMMLNYRN